MFRTGYRMLHLRYNAKCTLCYSYVMLLYTLSSVYVVLCIDHVTTTICRVYVMLYLYVVSCILYVASTLCCVHVPSHLCNAVYTLCCICITWCISHIPSTLCDVHITMHLRYWNKQIPYLRYAIYSHASRLRFATLYSACIYHHVRYRGALSAASHAPHVTKMTNACRAGR